MKIRGDYGSWERLSEIMLKVNNISLNKTPISGGNVINEQVEPEGNKNEIIKKFITFASNKIGLTKSTLPRITVSYDNGEAKKNKSFGGYIPHQETIRVVAANRNIADVLRTLGHELVHHKQKIDNRIKEDSGETGSSEENEANSMAGVLLREFGRANPIIFE